MEPIDVLLRDITCYFLHSSPQRAVDVLRSFIVNIAVRRANQQGN